MTQELRCIAGPGNSPYAAGMHPILDQLLDLVFPPRCAGCLQRGLLLCPACTRACRPVLPSANTALQQQLKTPFLASVAGAYIFENVLRRAIHVLKYDRCTRMAGPLGDLLACYVAVHPVAVDTIIPVPLHPERERVRGFNQAMMLAQQLAHHTGLPLSTMQLVRVRQTTQQVGLDRTQRRANVRGAFAWDAPTLPPARILLIDDVLTTGATIEAAAQALCAAGAYEVHALALARGL
jgi:ComF family protein